MIALTAHLIKKHKVWKNCPIRIFSVAESHGDAVLAKQYIENFMQTIRIRYSKIEVIVMESSAISAYTCQDNTINDPLEPTVLENLRKQRRALSRAAIDCQFTFSPIEGGLTNLIGHNLRQESKRKTHSAMRLNEAMNKHSGDASLIIVNLPPTPEQTKDDHAFMNFVEVLTLNLGPVLLVHGSGRELFTSV
ncbi:hypothetical protein ACOME3_005292 [Neoechinorhynchus agilis]